MTHLHSISSIEDLFSEKTRIGIIRGGTTPEYDLSLKTGGEILKRLHNKHSYDAVDVVIDKNGVWHINGKEINHRYLADYIDLAWIAIHGDNGETQSLLEELRIPYLGSDPISAELTFNRGKTKQRLRDLGLQTPDHVQMTAMYTGDMDEETREHFIEERGFEVFGKLPGPWVVKPVAFSARYHTYLARTFPELCTALRIISMDVDDILVEEYISGREFVSAVIPDFREQEKYTMTPHEIRHNDELFSHHSSQNGNFELIPTTQISDKIKNLITELTENLHRDFNLDDTGVFHFVMSPKGLYVISVQDSPEIHENAPFVQGLKHTGVSLDEFIHSRIARLFKKKK